MGLKHWGELMGTTKRSKQDSSQTRSILVSLTSWSQVVKGKVVGIDCSALFHGLFGSRTSAVSPRGTPQWCFGVVAAVPRVRM